MSEITTEVTETTETTEDKAYTLRELKASDMGAICKIITAIGIKEVRKLFADENVRELIKAIEDSKKDQPEGESDADIISKVGIGIMFDVAAMIISNIPKAETEIQAFLASLTGMKLSEIKEVPFADYGEMIMDVVMKEEFRDFFGRVVKLFK